MIRPLHMGIGLILLGGVACLPVTRGVAVVPVSGGSLPAAMRAAPGAAVTAAPRRPATDADATSAQAAPHERTGDLDAAPPAPSAPEKTSATAAPGDPSWTVVSAPVRTLTRQDGEAADALSRVLRDQVNQARRRAGLQVLDHHTGRILPGSSGVWYVNAQHPTRT